MNILTLLQEKSYGWIALLLFLSYVSWFIYFKLSYKIVSEKMPPMVYLAVLIMGSYVLGARPFIPGITFLILMCVLMVILQCILGRMSIYKSIYSAIFTIFISFLGNVFVYFVILGLYPNFFPFLTRTKFGFLIGGSIEVLFPIIALSITDPRLSLRLPLRKNDPFDLFDLGVSWILVCMYYIIDFALINAFETFQKNPQKIGSSLGLLFMSSFGIMSGVYILIKCMKFMHDREVNKLQKEKGQVEEEKEQVEAENMNLQEKMYTILDLNATLDPNVKKTIVDSFIAVFEEGTKKSSQPKPPFIINQSKMAQYGIEERDSKILAHLVLNKTNQEIAAELSFSEGHVKNSLTDLYKKFNINSRRQLARFAIENKLIEIP